MSERYSPGDKKSAKFSRRDFLKGLLTAAAVSAVPACDVNLSEGFCANPDKAEASLKYEFKFDEACHYSERQKKYVTDLIEQEMREYEPVFRQGITEITIYPPDGDEASNHGGRYNRFFNSIRVVGPYLDKSGKIELETFFTITSSMLAHEIGHRVDDMGGIKERYKAAGPLLYDSYYAPRSVNPRIITSPENEDAAVGFELYRKKRLAFPLFFFGQNPKNRNKYRSLREDTFCGQDYPIIPSRMANVIYRLYKSMLADHWSRETENQAVQQTYAGLRLDERDSRLELFYRYYLLHKRIDNPELSVLVAEYESLKESALATEWPLLAVEADLDLARKINLATPEIKIKKFRSAIDSHLLPLRLEAEARFDLASILKIVLGQKQEAAAILEPNIALSETTFASQAIKLLET
ncbi:MAG: twin-arginine translocation signal domain-containing protein [Candidatus Magasanikbacteria bacterium]|nr:twin-arginine translocation signal domain-containing protein [Candidatus Magasanikbacteria bacterium]